MATLIKDDRQAHQISPRKWIHRLFAGYPDLALSESALSRMAVKLMERENELCNWAKKEALKDRRPPKIHTLKTHCEEFQAILDGTKTSEYRKDDRGFNVGDLLVLREFNVMLGPFGKFTDRETTVSVTHITRAPSFGVPDGYCVMSVEHAGDLKAR